MDNYTTNFYDLDPAMWGIGCPWCDDDKPFHPDIKSREVWWTKERPVIYPLGGIILQTEYDPKYFESIDETIEQSAQQIYSKELFEPGIFEAIIEPPVAISKWAFWLYGEQTGAPEQSEIDIAEKINILDNITFSFNTHVYYKKCFEKNTARHQNIRNFTLRHFLDIKIKLIWVYRKRLEIYHNDKLVAIRTRLFNGKEVKNITHPQKLFFSNGWSPQITIHNKINSFFTIRQFNYKKL